MPVVYKNEQKKQKIESDRAGQRSFPLEASIREDMLDLTLRELSSRLIDQLKVDGIDLVSITFVKVNEL